LSGFFYHLGKIVGRQSRKARWAFQSLTGDEADALRAEEAVGRDLARAVLEQSPADPDPAVAQWVDEIGGLLAGAVRPPGRTFTFRTLLVPEPNAFALPGGFIFVTRSLLRLCQESHDDLAFVLGHEMAHVLRGHAIERLVAQSIIGPAVSRLSPFRLLAGPLAGLTANLLRASYSQDQEFEADRVGTALVRAAGFDPAAGPRLLGKLRLRFTDPTELAGYFSSHPPVELRIRNLREGVGV
jgi:beta-barrel assembly-enhancing protease